MTELWQENKKYSLLRSYAGWCTRRSYSSLKVEGKLPDDGRAVIVAPNHCNTLMDPMVILEVSGGPMAFGARADVFKNPKIAKILHFLRIVPIARQRDGLRSVAQNLEIIPEILDVLEHRMPFCLFPEGKHRTMYSLLPIRKGLVRIAMQSAEQRPTYILPTGLNYSDFLHYRGTCTVRFGEPIDVNRFMEENKDLPQPELFTKLSSELTERIKKLILYIPDDENYEARLAELRPPRKRRWWEIPALVLSAPLFVIASLLSLPLWGLAEYLCHFKIKDKAFSNSVRYLVRMFAGPLVFVIWAVLAFIILPPLGAAGVLVLYMFSYSFFYDWLNLAHKR